MENITILIGDDYVEIADLVAIHLEGYRLRYRMGKKILMLSRLNTLIYLF